MKVRGIVLVVAGVMLATGCASTPAPESVARGELATTQVAVISNARVAAAPAARTVPAATRAETRTQPLIKVPGSRYLAKPSGRGIAKSLRFHQGWWGRYSAKVERAALCVIRHESWGKMWKGQNPVSTASGAAQWINSTWRVNAARAGVPVTARARYAPPKDQAKVFAWMWTHGGKKAWRGTNCPGTY